MKNNLKFALLLALVTMPAFAQTKFDNRLTEAASVLKQMSAPDSIPSYAIQHAVCVVIFPSVTKVGVGIGMSYGRGVLSCRSGIHYDGPWSAPAMYKLDTGSLGVQLGGSSTDYVLLVESQTGAIKMLSGKLKLGADASAVAGPTGAKAVGANDIKTDILTYSRAKGGLFAGASLGSASMTSDDDANKSLYGKDITATQIVADHTIPVPSAGKPLISQLNHLSPKLK